MTAPTSAEARSAAESRVGRPAASEATASVFIKGKPAYMSPEQAWGKPMDRRSDIFSLGIVLYEILSGKRPFDGDTITSLVYQILHKEPPPVSELRAVPPRVDELLRGMLRKRWLARETAAEPRAARRTVRAP